MAHPLGNFSMNQYTRIEVGEKKLNLRCVLDMAEIPAFQESQQIDTDKDDALSQNELNVYLESVTRQYVSNLKLSVDNAELKLQTNHKQISLPMGSGNLPTIRIEWDFVAEIQNPNSNRLSFENLNYQERVGWNEIIVKPSVGIYVFDSNVFGNGLTDELKTYPEDILAAPLTERKASFSFSNSQPSANSKLLQNRDGHITSSVQKDRLAELISVKQVTPTIALIGLLIAFSLGAMHALSPGHGKTVVGAYLVGSRGTIKHAAFLGLTVTITHTLGVFALGLITLFASHFILPERIMPFLNFTSGLLVFFIGLTLFKDRLLSFFGHSNHHHQHHHHHHHHGDAFVHTHDGHTHSHLPPGVDGNPVTWRALLALGISGGLLPCPSALVLMLSAISFGRVGYGLVLTIAFSLGLAATLTTVGLFFLFVGKLFDRPSFGNNLLIKGLPVFSALVIACVGAVICYNSLSI